MNIRLLILFVVLFIVLVLNYRMSLSYHLITLGCQMNKNDSERLESIFRGMEMDATDKPEAADVIIMNSCSVRQAAEDRIYGFARNFVEFKKANPNLIICVTGCMPGRDKDRRLLAKLKGVDLYFPIQDMVYLPQWLSQLNPNLRPMEDMVKDYLSLRPTYQKKFQALVTIQTGCNHFCAYCVVPFSRGFEINRPLKDILTEVRELAAGGCLEVMLLGQIINHYRAPDQEHFSINNPYKKNHFAKLLWEINQIEGIRRIHWIAPHPLYMDDEMIDALTSLSKQVNYLHLPAQSGNNEILKKMNRRYDRDFYIDVIRKIKARQPNIAIGTDIIVGFCGETEDQFEDTMSLYKICDFDISYNAQYSERSGTVAAQIFEDIIPKEEKKLRWRRLQKLMEKIVLRKNQIYVGKEVEVLVDTWQLGWCGGNSREMKRVMFQANETLVGSLIQVKVNRVDEWMLWGKQIFNI